MLLLSLALPLSACGHASADRTVATPVPAPTAVAEATATAQPASGASTIDAVLADPAKHDGQRVHLKGTLTIGFEVSALDGKAWIRIAKYEGFPEGWRDGRGLGRAAVEVFGTVETDKGRYGHLGRYKAFVDAERVVYVGAAK